MFGYATDETEEAMPLTLILSHKLNARLHQLRRDGTLAWARPDSKSQVTIEYSYEKGACVPKRVHTIVLSVQHSPDVTQEQLHDDLEKKVISVVIPKHLYKDTKLHLNPCGTFIIGGPMGDAGKYLYIKFFKNSNTKIFHELFKPKKVNFLLLFQKQCFSFLSTPKYY